MVTDFNFFDSLKAPCIPRTAPFLYFLSLIHI